MTRVRIVSPILRGAVAAVVLLAATAAGAEDWPARPVQVISPFTAGNANDTVARIVLDQVSRQIGQAFVIENRPGGGGTIGTAMAANADADGYTLFLHSSSMSAQVVLHRTLPYDPIRDFAPVVLFGIQPSVLLTGPSRGFKTVADLVAAAKARPGALNFASAGIGSASHMAAERLRVAAGIDVQHIPFRGAEGLGEVMAGRIDFYFVPIAPAVPVIAAGKVAVLAVSTRERAASLPDVPTIAEAGYPQAEYLFWGGLSAPAKTPRVIIERLHAETQKALSLPAVQEGLAKLGVEPRPMSVDEFARFWRDDLAATVQLAKDAQMQPVE
jgi:tripartite-type tricarboxylate transporter receptor subunit TctC